MSLRSAILLLLAASGLWGQWGGELRLCLYSEPRRLHPALADDDASETVRYLTGGVLLRVNRVNQRLEPELATSWKVGNGGRNITFQVREGIPFSDGTPFTADDVAYTMEALMDPKLHSATGDSFRSGSGAVRAVARGRYEVVVTFPEPVAEVARLFDQVA